MNLEYFIASLPMLMPGHPPGITIEAFRAICAEHLTGRLALAVQALLDDAPGDHPFVRAWHAHETLLRNAIAAVLETLRSPTATVAQKYESAMSIIDRCTFDKSQMLLAISYKFIF